MPVPEDALVVRRNGSLRSKRPSASIQYAIHKAMAEPKRLESLFTVYSRQARSLHLFPLKPAIIPALQRPAVLGYSSHHVVWYPRVNICIDLQRHRHVWLIKPPEGRGIAYVDLRSAEFGIGAALSRDPNMMQDYRDMVVGRIECVYFELARRSGQVPCDAIVADHKPIRRLWKTAALAMIYGQSPEGLSAATGIPLSSARVIQDAFKRRYASFWNWIRQEIVRAHCLGKIETVCGWRLNVKQLTVDGEALTKDGTYRTSIRRPLAPTSCAALGVDGRLGDRNLRDRPRRRDDGGLDRHPGGHCAIRTRLLAPGEPGHSWLRAGR